jgi:V-type H+-transporting ATPase subunit C
MSLLGKYIVLSLPQSVDATEWLREKFQGEKSSVIKFDLPDFQSGTLDSLIQESEELNKIDGQLASSVSKVVEILSSVSETSSRIVHSRSVFDYIEKFSWDSNKYRLNKPISELVSLISSEALTFDSDVRASSQSYQSAKSNFTAANRKKNGDLSIRSLHDIVKPEQFVLNSEHLTTILVAVPNSMIKDFENSYETLVQFVIPRSATVIDSDTEYTLYGVTLFKKFESEFIAHAREKRWHPRVDFTYSEEVLNDLRKEFDLTKQTESKTKNDLIRLAKTAYSDIFASWMHIKAIRVYVESVLRYGLPPQFDYYMIKFKGSNCEKEFDKSKKELITKFGYLGGPTSANKTNLHEYASLVDGEYERFVLYDIGVV